MKVAAFIPDLMDRSRLGGVAAEVSFAKTVGDLPAVAAEHAVDLVVLDLGRPGTLDILSQLEDYRVVAFASHVDTETIAAAKAAGVSETMPRSRFFSQMQQIFS